MEITMEKAELGSSMQQHFQAVVSLAARLETNCWPGSYGHPKHLPVISMPGEKAQGGEKYVASNSGRQEYWSGFSGEIQEKELAGVTLDSYSAQECSQESQWIPEINVLKVKLAVRNRCAEFQRCSLNITWQTKTVWIYIGFTWQTITFWIYIGLSTISYKPSSLVSFSF